MAGHTLDCSTAPAVLQPPPLIALVFRIKMRMALETDAAKCAKTVKFFTKTMSLFEMSNEDEETGKSRCWTLPKNLQIVWNITELYNLTNTNTMMEPHITWKLCCSPSSEARFSTKHQPRAPQKSLEWQVVLYIKSCLRCQMIYHYIIKTERPTTIFPYILGYICAENYTNFYYVI